VEALFNDERPLRCPLRDVGFKVNASIKTIPFNKVKDLELLIMRAEET
jgi:hypothetical protein